MFQVRERLVLVLCHGGGAFGSFSRIPIIKKQNSPRPNNETMFRCLVHLTLTPLPSHSLSCHLTCHCLAVHGDGDGVVASQGCGGGGESVAQLAKSHHHVTQ